MKAEGLLLAGGIALLVGLLTLFFESAPGKKVGKYWPLPFWVYFVSIALAQLKILPAASDFYSFAGTILLAAAIFLMLVGSPLKDLLRIGKTAFLSVLVAAVSVFGASIVCFLLYRPILPEEGWKAAGALVGTWVGGSANMLAVKEIVGLSDAGLAPLILVDTILSYTWLALLFIGAGYQKYFDRGAVDTGVERVSISDEKAGGAASRGAKIFMIGGLIVIGILFSSLLMTGVKPLAAKFTLLSTTAWLLLLASSVAVALSATPVRKLETWGASSVGSFLLYMVLVTIGAKSQVGDIQATPVYLLYGVTLLLMHGAVLFGIGWFCKWPMYLLSTASQANIGGPVSAPIVANAYRAGTASLGVLMAIFGALVGTYMGALSSWICKKLAGG